MHNLSSALTAEQPFAILLIEDNPADAELAIRALRRGNLGEHIHLIQDGAEALDFLFCRGDYASRRITNQPKVILLDLKLPKMSGLDVLRQLKSDPRTQTIPVVVLTSSAEDRDVIECHRLGLNSYVVKPINFEQFNQVVQQIGDYWVGLNRSPMR